MNLAQQVSPESYNAQSHIAAMAAEHQRVVEGFFSQVGPSLESLADLVCESLRQGGKVILCGNGGSAADAQHIAAEFVGRFVKDRPALASIALTTDTSILTAVGNDYGYDEVFSRQVAGVGRKGDVLIGITTSGNSANVLKAFEVAQSMGIHTVALAGRDGGKAAPMAEQAFVVGSKITAHIQECHIMLLHMLCAVIEAKMGFDTPNQQ